MFVTWQGPNLHEQGDKSLFLKNVNISSSGKYTCSVENDAGEVVTALTHLTVQRKLVLNQRNHVCVTYVSVRFNIRPS